MEHFRRLMHTSRIPVRWGDMDAMGHVNNTIYFRYAEQSRIEWLESLGFSLDVGRDEAAVIVNASCTFLLPITYPATVEVLLYADRPGRSSVPTFYEMRCVGDEKLYAEGAAKVVWFHPATGKSMELPARIRALIESK
ncbi:MAG: acyl-CoA thioesterase [Gammaproteobacteria bacterium]|nr:acyl-CoA thioesterase [Gammaproteobacteria bacterium]MBU1416769.1 acyl-CoA thioesterase [Gammaproteobacteria bacterium]